MLVTLLVLWIIGVPVLTLTGTYVVSGLLRRRREKPSSGAQAAAATDRDG